VRKKNPSFFNKLSPVKSGDFLFSGQKKEDRKENIKDPKLVYNRI